jgi:hypothetical protein
VLDEAKIPGVAGNEDAAYSKNNSRDVQIADADTNALLA